MKVSAEAACVYNVHIHVMCRRARMGFMCLSECTRRKRVLSGQEDQFEAFAFDVYPATQRGVCLRASRAVC